MAHRVIGSVQRVALAVVVAAMCGRAYDESASRFWKDLESGIPQTLVLHGTSLSHPQFSPWDTMIGPAITAQVGPGLLTVVNVSPSGGNWSTTGADSIGNVVALRPDAVILEFASNDAVNRLDCTIDGCARPNWVTMITRLQQDLPDCSIFLYVTAPPWDLVSCGATPCRYCTEQYAQRCRRSARASNSDTVEQYFDMVRELADTYHVHLIDTYWRFRDNYDSSFATYRNWIYDGHHPTLLASREIIVPCMLAAMQGKPVAFTAPRPGDTLRVGSPFTMRWDFEPDSVNLVTFDISVNARVYWLPLVLESVPPQPCSLTMVCPASIQGEPVAGNEVYLRVSQYNSSLLVDDVGPLTVVASSASAGPPSVQPGRRDGRLDRKVISDQARTRCRAGTPVADLRGRVVPASGLPAGVYFVSRGATHH